MFDFIRAIGVSPTSPLVQKENLYGLLFAVLTWAKLGGLVPQDTEVEVATVAAVQIILAIIAFVNFVRAAMTKGRAPVVGVVTLALIVVGVALSFAQEAKAEPLYDWKRIAAGADIGAAYLQPLDSVRLNEPGLRVAPYVSASISEQLSLVAKYGWDLTHGSGRGTLGARVAVVGFEEGDRVQAGLLFDRAWYSGDAYSVDESWAAGIAMSWLAATLRGRDAVYAKVQAAYDDKTGYDVSVALGLNLIGGKP